MNSAIFVAPRRLRLCDVQRVEVRDGENRDSSGVSQQYFDKACF